MNNRLEHESEVAEFADPLHSLHVSFNISSILGVKIST